MLLTDLVGHEHSTHTNETEIRPLVAFQGHRIGSAATSGTDETRRIGALVGCGTRDRPCELNADDAEKPRSTWTSSDCLTEFAEATSSSVNTGLYLYYLDETKTF